MNVVVYVFCFVVVVLCEDYVVLKFVVVCVVCMCFGCIDVFGECVCVYCVFFVIGCFIVVLWCSMVSVVYW